MKNLRTMTSPYKAWMCGVCAKQRGWARISPFSNDPCADLMFVLGYDGESYNAGLTRLTRTLNAVVDHSTVGERPPETLSA